MATNSRFPEPQALTVIPSSGVDPARYESREMIQTLKETVCKGATDSQFKMFVEVCKSTGLNPFLKEIWFVPNVGVMAGRDGYLRVANDHPMFDGMSTLVDRDTDGVPVKATCTVWRKDRSHPIVCEAYYNEYRKSSSVWTTYKSAMIGKVAEVLALKRSFAINGVVTEEEIGEQPNVAQQEVATRRIEEERGKVAAAKQEAPRQAPAPFAPTAAPAAAPAPAVEDMENIPEELHHMFQHLEEKGMSAQAMATVKENLIMAKPQTGLAEWSQLLAKHGIKPRGNTYSSVRALVLDAFEAAQDAPALRDAYSATDDDIPTELFEKGKEPSYGVD